MGFELPQLRVKEVNTDIENAYAFHLNHLYSQDAEIAAYTDKLASSYRWKGLQQTALQIPKSLVNVTAAIAIVLFKLIGSTLATLQSITHCIRRTLGQRVEMTFQRELIEIIDDWRSTAISIGFFVKTVLFVPVQMLSGPIQVIDPVTGLKLRRWLRFVDLEFFKLELDLSPTSICVKSHKIVSDAFSSESIVSSVLRLHSDLKNRSDSFRSSMIIEKIVEGIRKPERD